MIGLQNLLWRFELIHISIYVCFIIMLISMYDDVMHLWLCLFIHVMYVILCLSIIVTLPYHKISLKLLRHPTF
jgi:hypothetical protein